MKSQLSSFDIAALVRELQQCIGLRVEKIFLQGYDDLFVRLTDINVKKTISIKLGKSMWLKDGFRKSKSVEPPTFAMLLRKYISGKPIKAITQHGFDRVVVFELEGGFRLIAEMFGAGNIILVEGEKIVQPLTSKSWKARELKAGHAYKFPPDSRNPLALSQEEVFGTVRGSQKDLVRCLAMEVNLGGVYAEDICHSLARDKNLKTGELEDEEIEEIYEIIQSFKEMLDSPLPHIVYDEDDAQVDVLPFELSMHSGLDRKYYDSFSMALVDYFATLPENIEPAVPKKSGRQEELERRLASQYKAMEELESQSVEYQRIGDMIYANYSMLENILSRVGKLLEGGNWQAERRAIKEMGDVVDFNPSDGILTVALGDGTRVNLDMRLNINDNASGYYERSKRARQKLDGAETAVEETRRLLKSAARDNDVERDAGAKKPTKRFWFDRFRWFRSSQGHMVVGGRDARTNDQVVKKHLKDEHLYAHADMGGAPSVVIKGAGPEDEATLHEACIFAICFSKAWKSKIASGSAYWVKPDQVSKTPQPGEFLARGAFVIRGKRNYSKKLDLQLGIGMVKIQDADKVMCGPVPALKALTEQYYVIEPGNEKRTDFSKRLSDEFNVPIEEIDRAMPTGGIRVVKTPTR